jgi:dipeptidyl aminopeptidase/acylaminoacyl peptidase
MIALLLAAALPYGADRLSNAREITEAALRPDGKEAAFISDISGALEVWSVPMEGGWPRQLSWLGEQASDLTWSPDGAELAFASDRGGDERPDLYRIKDGSLFQVTATTRAENDPRYSPDGKRLAYLADPQVEFLYQLMVLNLETGEHRQLTREPMNVHFPVWSPDGRTIAVTRSGDDQSGPLLLVDAETGAAVEVAPPVKDGIIIPQLFKDDKTLLCTARNERGFLQLFEIAIGPDMKGVFKGPGDWDVEHVKRGPNGSLLFDQNVAGASALWRGGNRILPAAGRIEDLDASKDGRTAVLVRSDSASPYDLWLVDVPAGKQRRLTNLSAGVVEPGRLSTGTIIRYSSFDGREISAIYIKPKVHHLGAPAPVVVMVHGGPDWQSFDDFQPMRQALAEAGIAVLAPNFRGSTGFGWEFLAANRKDWGGGDLKDLVEGVKFLAAKGEIDSKRAGITGGSYGGFMTLIALVKTPDVWKAGVEAYGMPDLFLDYEIAYTRFKDWYETQMGNPKTHKELFKDRSAINHLKAMRAPLLIFQGANDTNVPAAESELIYKALKKRKHPVELVVYPDEGHGFTRRVNRLDYYGRTVEFFKRNLGLAR